MIDAIKEKIRLWKKDIKYFEERREELKNKSMMTGEEAIEYIQCSQNINRIKDLMTEIILRDEDYYE